jgi:hypothetical protein
MPTYAIVLLVPSLMAGSVPVARWIVRRRRKPCPYCGRRASRVVREVHAPAGLAPRALTYACRACGGALRYARRPNGEEFWVPIDGVEGAETPCA